MTTIPLTNHKLTLFNMLMKDFRCPLIQYKQKQDKQFSIYIRDPNISGDEFIGKYSPKGRSFKEWKLNIA